MVSFDLDDIVRKFTYSKGSIETYIRQFSKYLYGNTLRINGKSVYEDHPLRISKEVDLLIIDRLRSSRVRSEALGHDIFEDFKKHLGVYNPFGPRPKQTDGIIFMNDLLKNAGEDAYELLYSFDILTNRNQDYGPYIRNIFLPENYEYIEIHNESSLVKLVDGHVNTDIKEFIARDMNFKTRKMLNSRVDKNVNCLLPSAEKGLLILQNNVKKLANEFLIEQVFSEIIQDTASIARALNPDVNFETLFKNSLELVYPNGKANITEKVLHEYNKGRLSLGSYK